MTTSYPTLQEELEAMCEVTPPMRAGLLEATDRYAQSVIDNLIRIKSAETDIYLSLYRERVCREQSEKDREEDHWEPIPEKFTMTTAVELHLDLAPYASEDSECNVDATAHIDVAGIWFLRLTSLQDRWLFGYTLGGWGHYLYSVPMLNAGVVAEEAARFLDATPFDTSARWEPRSAVNRARTDQETAALTKCLDRLARPLPPGQRGPGGMVIQSLR